MSVRAATTALIGESHRYGAFHGENLSNHLPMVLVALDRMGADDRALRGFAARYATILEPMRAPAFAIDGNPGAWLGRREAFAAWVAWFEARLASGEERSVVSEWAARLLPGIASGAFHGLIRLAYALESGSRPELAHALAYWASAWESLGEAAPVPAGAATPAQVLADLASHPDFRGIRRGSGNIAARIRAAASEPGFEEIVSRVREDALTIEGLAAALVRAFAASGDFTVLHGVTACHALRLLMPFLPDGKAAVAHLWRGLAGAYIGAGSPAVAPETIAGTRGLDWPEILRLACACDDEHDVKLAYTCWREWQCYGDDIYRRAACGRVARAGATREPPR